MDLFKFFIVSSAFFYLGIQFKESGENTVLTQELFKTNLRNSSLATVYAAQWVWEKVQLLLSLVDLSSTDNDTPQE